MVLEEMIFIDSEFQVEIRDMNFINVSANTNIVNSMDNSSISSLYSWSTSLRRLSAQSMANNQENLSKTSLDGQTLSSVRYQVLTVNQVLITNQVPIKIMIRLIILIVLCQIIK